MLFFSYVNFKESGLKTYFVWVALFMVQCRKSSYYMYMRILEINLKEASNEVLMVSTSLQFSNPEEEVIV